MIVFGLLAWYDEPVDDLARAIKSAAGICDHIIAIDGRYQHFATHKDAWSHYTQQQAIDVACRDLGIASTIHTPTQPWPSEGAKRTTLFAIAEALGTPGTDWVIPIDADEEFVCDDPAAFRDRLANSDQPVIGLHYETPVAERTPLLEASTDLRTVTLPRILRLHSGMYVVPPTHYKFATRSGLDLSRAIQWAPGIKMLHHTASRPISRQQTKAAYIAKRNEIGEC